MFTLSYTKPWSVCSMCLCIRSQLQNAPHSSAPLPLWCIDSAPSTSFVWHSELAPMLSSVNQGKHKMHWRGWRWTGNGSEHQDFQFTLKSTSKIPDVVKWFKYQKDQCKCDLTSRWLKKKTFTPDELFIAEAEGGGLLGSSEREKKSLHFKPTLMKAFCSLYNAMQEHRVINTAINTVPTRLIGRLKLTLAGAMRPCTTNTQTDIRHHTQHWAKRFCFHLKLQRS